MSCSSTIINSADNEQQWVIQIKEILNQELKNGELKPPCIFQVPKPLSSSKPEAYSPQLIALGPYHHLRPEVYGMERFKLGVARSRFKDNNNENPVQIANNFVDKLKQLDLRIRACYHKYLDLDADTLALVMAIDGTFLIEFCRTYSSGQFKRLRRGESVAAPLFDCGGRKLTDHAMLRDLVMLENQIPLFVLKELFPDEKMLGEILYDFCRQISPLKVAECPHPIHLFRNCSHLLHLLYTLIIFKKVVKKSQAVRRGAAGRQAEAVGLTSELLQAAPIDSSVFNQIKKVFAVIPALISRIKQIYTLIQNFLSNSSTEMTDQNLSSNGGAPTVEEIKKIPSALALSKAGVNFSSKCGTGSKIQFDEKTVTLHLPGITLDVYSEVIMRNLVAYEASAMADDLIFMRYTEFMNRMVDNAEDVKLLREKGIIVNNLKSDDEVAEIFNGMSESIALTEESDFNKTIRGINKYYYNTRKVKFSRFRKTCASISLELFVIFVAISLLVLQCMQAICSFANCHSIYKNK